jgi:ABC-type branched-subunit amino acid transport system permease subunit
VSAVLEQAVPAPAARWAVKPYHILVAAFLLIYPFIAPPFWTFQIGGQSLFLGLIGLSLMFLGCAAFGYFAVLYLSRSTFGLGLQAIRDNPRSAIPALKATY